MEEYITSIRQGAIIVEELIQILQQFDGKATVYISLEIGQLDLYRLENGDLEIL